MSAFETPWIRRLAGRLWLLLVLASTQLTGAQTSSNSAPPAPDPLMTLMLSQPGIDVQSPVKPSAVFEPPIISAGGQATYRVVLNALEAGVVWPERLPEVAGLKLRAGGRGQVLQPGGTNLQPRTTFLYRATPSATGRYTIPEYKVQAYGRTVTVPAAALEVTEPTGGRRPRPQLLNLIFPSTNLFVGQAVRARLTLSSDTNGFSQSLAYVRFVGDGVVADQSSVQQRIEPLPDASGGTGATYVYELFVTPIASGDLSVFAQGYTASSRFSGPIVITGGTVTLAGGPPQFLLLDSDPLMLRVKPLPNTGLLPGFKGAVGLFKLDPPKLSTNVVRVGQPVKLSINVRGTGNLSRLVPPEPPRHKNWQVFTAPLDPVPSQVQHMQGFVTFSFNLIPLSDEVRATPAIPYSYFDPSSETYIDLTIPSTPINVLAGGPAAAALPPDPEPSPEEIETLQLADLASTPGPVAARLVPAQERAWFPLIQLAPAMAFLGMVIWDRRRRFHELHPEVLLKRRARRLLHRFWSEARRAAASGNGAQFAGSAVKAMQAGCAPFFPANPQALVGAEVLGFLPESLRGNALKTLFHEADASQFGNEVPASDTLIASAPEVERALQYLDERLRI